MIETYYCTICGRDHKVDSAIGKRHWETYSKGLQPKRKPPVFKREYNKLIRRAGVFDSGAASPIMRKVLPPYMVKMLSNAARSENEWGGGVDFELLEDAPERVLMVRGRDDQVQRDADFELNFHTHPPPLEGMGGYTMNVFPSAADVAQTSFNKPELITVRDNDGRTRHVLIKSTHPRMQPECKKRIEAIFRDLLAKYRYPFPTREDRARFGKEYKKALNELGYDFEYVQLDRRVIAMRRDDVPERSVHLGRKGAIERRILSAFKQHGFDPEIYAAFLRGGKLRLAWIGPKEIVDRHKLASWMASNDLSIESTYDYEDAFLPGHQHNEIIISYRPGPRTANEPGGPSWRTSKRPRRPARRGKK